MLAKTPKETTKELWPRVRPTPCCKCPAYFESEAANIYVAVCDKQEGWDCGLDVDGNVVAYCPTHALPRVEWDEDLIYVRADETLELGAFSEAARYVIDRRSDTGEYSARVVAPGFDMLVCDQPPIWASPGSATYICYFSSEDYARRLGQAALRCFLAMCDDWRSARLESRVKHLEKINARLMKALLGRL